MNRRSHRTRISGRLLAAGVMAALSMTGCKDFMVDVELKADGSGVRSVALHSSDDYDAHSKPSQTEFRRLFGLQEQEGWRFVPAADRSSSEDRDGKMVFRRVEQVAEPSHWLRQSGDIHIRGAIDSDAFGDVEFKNDVAVELGGDADYGTITYRESFAWHELEEVLIGLMAERFGERLREEIPNLNDDDVAELEGLMAGHLALSLHALIAEEEQAETIAVSIATFARRVIGKRKPGPAASTVAEVAKDVIDFSDDTLTKRFETLLPGADLSVWTDVTVNVRMPGEIIDSNADEISDGVALWKFDVYDAATRPVELFVRSRVAR